MRNGSVRLAATDEANLVLDRADQVNVFLVAGYLAPGGFIGPDGTPEMSMLRTVLKERIDVLAPLRRVPVPVAGGHRWADAPAELEHHVRLSDPVDDLAGLEAKCAELMSVPLPRNRPLWELLVVPSAASGSTGIVLRIHHAVADGIAAVAIVQQLFGVASPHLTATAALPGAGQPPGHRQRLKFIAKLRLGVRRVYLTLRGREVGATVLLGARTSQRGVAFVSADVAALEARMRPVGATVNDALLAAVASGYRALLPIVAEPVPNQLPVSVPVALPRRGTSGNQVGVMLVRLPLGEPSPNVRLQLIAEQTRAAKVTARQQGTFEFMRGPFGARIMDRVTRNQHLVAGFVTNVPGPADTLTLAGAPVAAIWPVGVLAGNIRLGVAAVSYRGRLNCGIHFDAATLPGDVFADAVGEELARLSS